MQCNFEIVFSELKDFDTKIKDLFGIKKFLDAFFYFFLKKISTWDLFLGGLLLLTSCFLIVIQI
jgi:hypothetical protein